MNFHKIEFFTQSTLLIVVFEKILDTLSKVMNFQCDLYEPVNADTELWGRKQYGTGVFTGLLGKVGVSY